MTPHQPSSTSRKSGVTHFMIGLKIAGMRMSRALAETAALSPFIVAERTPAKDRTTDDFVDAMQLVDQLLAVVPVDEARAYRARLREITVRVVTHFLFHGVDPHHSYRDSTKSVA